MKLIFIVKNRNTTLVGYLYDSSTELSFCSKHNMGRNEKYKSQQASCSSHATLYTRWTAIERSQPRIQFEEPNPYQNLRIKGYIPVTFYWMWNKKS